MLESAGWCGVSNTGLKGFGRHVLNRVAGWDRAVTNAESSYRARFGLGEKRSVPLGRCFRSCFKISSKNPSSNSGSGSSIDLARLLRRESCSKRVVGRSGVCSSGLDLSGGDNA